MSKSEINYKTIREQNVRTLLEIRDDPEAPPSVKIQAIQTMSKIMAENPVEDDETSAASIMEKIRGQKKNGI
ncbi:MAG: hypothetical protein MJ000_10830 [Bacteroidales bacterium]|nr:hypothetical protein [Bacteroidales bacterium]